MTTPICIAIPKPLKASKKNGQGRVSLNIFDVVAKKRHAQSWN
jgi:hypothetical protein